MSVISTSIFRLNAVEPSEFDDFIVATVALIFLRYLVRCETMSSDIVV